ncbi:MAG: hypothetical protein FWF27_00750 [Candidatus Bathyarchaeota archaeon]|nr:hypothetical protein [Candidatus Termiticorpusculum sp.]
MVRRLRKKSIGPFTVLIICSITLLLVEPCVAPITKPATPTFTIEEISSPYDVPTTTTTIVDGYTGEEKTTTHPGYHVENTTIYIKIKNQPFDQPLTMDPSDCSNWLFYQYRYKGHYTGEKEWISFTSMYNNVYQSYTDYTLIPFPQDMPRYGQIDIQVRAAIGTYDYYPAYTKLPYSHYEFSGFLSDWSDIVVVSFDPLSFTVLPSTSTPSTDTPDQLTPDYTTPPLTSEPIDSQPPNAPPQQSPWASYLLTIIVTACIVIIPIAIVTYLNKQQKRKNNNPITQTAFAFKITMEGVKHGTVV